MPDKNTAHRLGQLVEVMQQTDSADSQEVLDFVASHPEDAEFQELSQTSRWLWRKFNPIREEDRRRAEVKWWQFWKWSL